MKSKFLVRIGALALSLLVPAAVLGPGRGHRPQGNRVHRRGQVPEDERLLHAGVGGREAPRVLPPGDALHLVLRRNELERSLPLGRHPPRPSKALIGKTIFYYLDVQGGGRPYVRVRPGRGGKRGGVPEQGDRSPVRDRPRRGLPLVPPLFIGGGVSSGVVAGGVAAAAAVAGGAILLTNDDSTAATTPATTARHQSAGDGAARDRASRRHTPTGRPRSSSRARRRRATARRRCGCPLRPSSPEAPAATSSCGSSGTAPPTATRTRRTRS